jgi:hypothetical protein
VSIWHRGNASPSSTALSSGRDGSQFSIHSDDLSAAPSPTANHQLDKQQEEEEEVTIVPMRLEFEEEPPPPPPPPGGDDEDAVVTPTTVESPASLSAGARSATVATSPRHRLASAAATASAETGDALDSPQTETDDDESPRVGGSRRDELEFRTPLRTLTKTTSMQVQVARLPAVPAVVACRDGDDAVVTPSEGAAAAHVVPETV